MKNFNNIKIIGVDAGYGNMKTASCCSDHEQFIKPLHKP